MTLPTRRILAGSTPSRSRLVTPLGSELAKRTPGSAPTTREAFTPERGRQLAEASVAAQFETVADEFVNAMPVPVEV